MECGARFYVGRANSRVSNLFATQAEARRKKGGQALTSAVVSNRVEADLRDKLPPGATEAEFAYPKAQSIDGPYNYFGSKRDDEVLMPDAVQNADRYAMMRRTA
jgi:hypothetical protein